MSTSRLEAFSDGVLAIIITIMVLELDLPEGDTFHSFVSTVGLSLLSYLLSFVFVGIYWNNHHHMLNVTERVTGGMLWANLHLLFWLSLLPFTTTWMDQTSLAPTPVVIYGVNLLAAAIAYFILQEVIIASQLPDTRLKDALGRDFKGKLSPAIYLAGIGSAWLSEAGSRAWTYLAIAAFAAVAILWLVPDKRIERLTEP